jgi:hypothetical protein
MKNRLLAAAAAVLSVAAVAAPAQAAPVTYTVSGTFDVNAGGQDYSDLNLTFTGVGDTKDTTPDLFGANDLATPLSTFTVTGSPFGSFTYSDKFAFFSNQGTQIAGFYDYTTNNDIIDLTSPDFASYQGKTTLSQRNVDFSEFYIPDGTSNTPFGPAYITGARDVTFGAEVAAVPEPASWAMMIGGVGMAGGALRRQRRTAVSKVSFA